MNERWKKLLIKVTVWIAIEISLIYLGLDDLADYGEFVFTRNEIDIKSFVFWSFVIPELSA